MTTNQRKFYSAYFTMLGRAQESTRRKDYKRSRIQCFAALKILKKFTNEPTAKTK